MDLTPEGIALHGLRPATIPWGQITILGPEASRTDWVIGIRTLAGATHQIRGSALAADPSVVLQLLLDHWTAPSRREELATEAALVRARALGDAAASATRDGSESPG